MTIETPSPGTEAAFETLWEIRDAMFVLEGLVVMLDYGAELLDRKASPLGALITCAHPLAKKLALSLDTYGTRNCK